MSDAVIVELSKIMANLAVTVLWFVLVKYFYGQVNNAIKDAKSKVPRWYNSLEKSAVETQGYSKLIWIIFCFILSPIKLDLRVKIAFGMLTLFITGVSTIWAPSIIDLAGKISDGYFESQKK